MKYKVEKTKQYWTLSVQETNNLIWFDSLVSCKVLFEVIWGSDTKPENLFESIWYYLILTKFDSFDLGFSVKTFYSIWLDQLLIKGVKE